MNPTTGVETAPKGGPEANPPSGTAPSLGDRLLKILQFETQRAFTVEGLVNLLKMQSPKDPEKQAQAVKQIRDELVRLTAAGELREVGKDVFKTRSYFDPEHAIEHVFIGGMGNVHYKFTGSFFRLNIGVLSVYFFRREKHKDWLVSIKDTTIGRDYGLVRHVTDGTYVIGSREPKPEEKNFIRIDGRYIAKEHLTLEISGEEIRFEDHNTPTGTRIDHFTPEGFEIYRKAAKSFLAGADPSDRGDPVIRGRYALEQLLKHHKNLESTFFSGMVDYLLQGDPPAAKKA